MEITRLSNNTKILNTIYIKDYIFCNKSYSVEIYSKLLELVYSLPTSEYIKLIIKYSEDVLIFFNNDDQYCFLSFNGKNINEFLKYNLLYNDEKFKNVFNNLKFYGKLCLENFKYHYIYKNTIVMYNKKFIKFFKVCNYEIIEDDSPNDLHFYNLVFISINSNLNIIVRDVEGSIFYLKYSFSEQNIPILNKKIKKWCSCIFEYKEGFLVINDNTIWYEVNNKKVCTSEFGNCFVVSSLLYKDYLVLSMEDGEIIYIRLFENAFEIEIYQYMNSFENMHVIGNHIFGFSSVGVSCLFNKENLVSKIDSICDLNNVKNDNFKLTFSNERYTYTLTNMIRTEIDKFAKEKVEIFFLFENLLICSYKNRFTINLQNKVIHDEKYSIREFYECDRMLYFYTKFKIYILSKLNKQRVFFNSLLLDENFVLQYKKFEEILICKFFKHDFIILDIQNNLLTRNKQIKTNLNISCILYNVDIYVSTYNNQFIILNKDLKEIQNFSYITFIIGVPNNNILYLYGTDENLYKFETIKNEKKIIGKYKNVKNLVCINNDLFIITNENCFINNYLLNVFFNYIVYYNGVYYISKKGIYFLDISKPCSYNFTRKNTKYLFNDRMIKVYNKDDYGLIKLNKKKFTKNAKDFFNKDNKFNESESLIFETCIKKCIQFDKKKYYILTKNLIYLICAISKKIKILKKININDCIDMRIHKDKLIYYTHNEIFDDGEKIIYYKGIIETIDINYNIILIVDKFKGFSVYGLDGSFRAKIYDEKWILGCIYKFKEEIFYILSNNKHIFVFVFSDNTKKFNLRKKFKINDKIVNFSQQSLDINEKCVYCLTSCNSLFVLKFLN